MKVTIVMPALNEERYIQQTLVSLKEQKDIPRGLAEIVVVDSLSSDETYNIAANYADVIQSGPGKLTARDAGVRYASGEIIVAVDADTKYPPYWLSRTLRHFANPGVVAVTGPRMHELDGGLISGPASFANGRLFGSNSAFRKNAYLASGGFDLSVNQQNSAAMVEEEEVKFPARLSQYGRIIFDLSAYVWTSSRRFVADDPAYIQQIKTGGRF